MPGTGNDWARVAATTINNYIRDETNNVMRNRKLSALLMAKKRFSYNWSGDEMEWPVRYRQVPMKGFGPGQTRNFPQQNRHKKAHLGWRAYYASDSITKFEKLKNRGKEAIINVFDRMSKDLMEDMKEQWGEEFYLDGNAAANVLRIHGIESFLAVTGSAGAVFGTPNDSFAGLSTVLATYGGTWTGTWPTNGKGSASYDFWSPVVVNYTSTGWAGATATWADNCKKALRYGIIKSKRSKASSGGLDVVIVDDEMYRLFLEKYDSSERLIAKQATGLTALGFSDVTNFDGTDVTYEYGIPAGVGYGFNCQEMEVRSMQDELWVADGPVYDEGTSAWRVAIDFYGNCVWNPRHFVAFKAVA